jgi:cytosine/adenosine deaminase-related metal-dependent hydrolase
MSTLLVKNARLLITMNDQRSQIQDGGLFVRDHRIEQVGASADLPADADQVIDASHLVILPGLVNTHHHFFQSMFRAMPGAQDHGLFEWLTRLLPFYGEVTEEAVYVASLTAMAEMMLSGCTTSSDHLYLYPGGKTIDVQVSAAREIGLRFHATRGAISVGRSQGGMTPDNLVQTEAEILEDCERILGLHHDPEPYSMIRIGLAPCTPFTVTKKLMRETAKLARTGRNVGLHTHVAETKDEEKYCLDQFNQRPAEYMQEVGWVGPDVWWAHSIFLNQAEIQMLARTGTGVAHCPSSNMRLGSGICPVREMLDAGVKVAIGVDGSASNDTGHLLNEARTAVLLQRVVNGAHAFSIEEGLSLATRGGAAVLGRENEIGSLQPGKAADFIGVDLDTLSMAGGAVHDPAAALLLCHVARVDLSVIHGKMVIQGGKLLTIAEDRLVARHNALAAGMVAHHAPADRARQIEAKLSLPQKGHPYDPTNKR